MRHVSACTSAGAHAHVMVRVNRQTGSAYCLPGLCDLSCRLCKEPLSGSIYIIREEVRPHSPCLTWWPLTLNGLQHVSYPPREELLARANKLYILTFPPGSGCGGLPSSSQTHVAREKCDRGKHKHHTELLRKNTVLIFMRIKPRGKFS